MKKIYSLLLSLLFAAPALAQEAQERMLLLKPSGETLFSISVSEVDSVTFTKDDGQGTGNLVNGHPFVDLGLPSGTLWASYNVGADSSTDDGFYFGWGETEENLKLTEANAKWQKKLYPHDRLAAEDDAATAKWGAPWRIPTKEEVDELLNRGNTTWTKVTSYGGETVTGFVVESNTNGNKIFFPSSGIYYNGKPMGKGGYCMYWSATPFVGEGNLENQQAYILTPEAYGNPQNAANLGLRSDAIPVRAVVSPTR